MTISRIGLDWPSHPSTGWGLVAAGLRKQWEAMGIEVVEITNSDLVDSPVLHALGNQFAGAPPCSNTLDVALPVFEDAHLTPEAYQARAMTYDVIVTASQWNKDVLNRYGISSVLIHQGIDADLFQPAPKQRLFGDRLTVFSGGKLEYRKGQDQVIAAFRELLRFEPDALLVTAWHNHWPIVPFVAGQHVDWTPGGTHFSLLYNWLKDHGIPGPNQYHVGPIPNEQLPAFLHSCDVAVFPSRAEGGTNLAAMEAMAAGVPTLISDSTGHKDLPRDSCMRMLETAATPGHEDWREIDIMDWAWALGYCRPLPERTPLTGWTQQRYAADLLSLIQTLTGGRA